MPVAPRQTWYCSVSLRWKRRPGGGVRTSGRRTCGPRRAASFPRSAFWSSATSLSCWMFPAAETTMFPPVYIDR